MEKTIKLTMPINVDGKEIKELKFDTGKATQSMNNFCIAESARITAGTFSAIETDQAYHAVLGKAIAAASNDLVYEDLNSLSFADAMKLEIEGRNFLYQSLGYSSATEDTDQAEAKGKSQKKNTEKSEAEN